MIHKPTPKKRSATRTVTSKPDTAWLSPLEEQVVRMRHGFTVPATMALASKDGGDPALAAQLEAIERRALGAAGTRQNAKKSKIVNALRRKH